MKSKKGLIFVLVALDILAVLFSFHSGPVEVPWNEIFLFMTGRYDNEQAHYIITALRAPRTLAAFGIGGALGAAGLVLQTLLRNPLAEPYTLGLSGGGALGAVIALAFALEPASLWVPALSAVGCLASSGLVLALGRKSLEFESRSLILFGVMISLFMGAVVVSGMSVLSPDKLQAALFWLMGEFGTSRDSWMQFLGPCLILLIGILFTQSGALDALSLGEARSVSLGYSPSRKRILLILICTLLTAFAVSISGLVGFVGLVSPHLARRASRTSRHSYLLVYSVLIGAALLTFADSLGRSIAGTTEIPAGSVAALLGAPALILLLMRYRHAPAD
jgi:iron complex transport system permease protein